MEKLFITNRDGKRLAIIVDVPKQPRGLAFVAHGLGGRKEEPHTTEFARAFFDENYITIRWDARNTFGESEGAYEDATVTNYFEDMEDVMVWARTQSWYHEPFFLAGHSLGGIITLLYAEQHPKKVLGLAPISTVVSGKLSMESRIQEHGQAQIDEWKKTGWVERVGSSGKIKRIRWHEMEERQKYDTLAHAQKITMPVLMIVGENDPTTPVKHQQLLFDAIPGKKEMHILPGQAHVFKGEETLERIYELFRAWIQKSTHQARHEQKVN